MLFLREHYIGYVKPVYANRNLKAIYVILNMPVTTLREVKRYRGNSSLIKNILFHLIYYHFNN